MTLKLIFTMAQSKSPTKASNLDLDPALSMNVDLAHVPLPSSARDDRHKGAAVHTSPPRHSDHKIRLIQIPVSSTSKS